MNIWQNCNGVNSIIPLKRCGYRVVESQRYIGMRKTVDSDAEYNTIEKLIETVKSPIPSGTENLNYLLYTPFRYQLPDETLIKNLKKDALKKPFFEPSEYPSPFRKNGEASIFYGALDNIQIAFAESAYHYFLRLSASEAPVKHVLTSMASFKFEVRTNSGINLTQHPFLEYYTYIHSDDDYQASQELCHSMRQDNIEAFIYDSVRDDGKNIAVLNPKAFAKKKPDDIREWHCFMDADNIEFSQYSTHQKYLFPKNKFFK